MGFFLILVLVCIWVVFSVLIAKFTKTHFLWTFLLGLIGTIIALLAKIADNVAQDEKKQVLNG